MEVIEVVTTQSEMEINGGAGAYPQVRHVMGANRTTTRVLWVGVIFLAFIGIAVAARRAVILINPRAMSAGKNPATGLDEHFAKEKALTLLHVLPGMIALGKALWHALHREFATHREWMIRGYAVGLAVATIRPIMASFFAVAVMQGHTPEPSKFFGTAFWIGFTAQAIVAEIWVRRTRPATFGELVTQAPG